MAGRSWNHKNHYIRTVDLFILARYRDRTVSDRSLSSTVHGLTSVTVHRYAKSYLSTQLLTHWKIITAYK